MQCAYCVGDPFLLHLLLFRYTLWFRTSCPQPQQFQAAAEECMVGQLTLAFSGLPVGDSLSFVFSSSPGSPTHPLPYMSYEFLLQAENSIGAVNATMFSSIVTTPADGELIHAGLPTHCHKLVQDPTFRSVVPQTLQVLSPQTLLVAVFEICATLF